jgi:tetratricopeptide (TPR) repeat protein
LNNPAAKVAAGLVLLSVCSLLVVGIVSNFTVGVLTDERVTIPPNTLAAASGFYPYSSRLHARLAQVSEQESDLSQARDHALSAVRLSPHNYNYRLLLASIEEATGDSAAAEQSLKAGLALAPNKTEVHWQLANLLLREGGLEQAVDQFRAACALDAKLLPVTLNLVSRSSGGNLQALEAVTDSQPEARLTLARFLLKHDNAGDASRIFGQLGPRVRLAAKEAREFLESLIAAGDLSLARDLWIGTHADAGRDPRLIWNGSFESDIAKEFAQFDWITSNNEYAKIRIGAGVARTGSRSLRIEFAGRDTTRLDGEIKQMVLLRPNAHYGIECYANAERLVTPEGPRVVMTTINSHDSIAASEPIAAGQPGWQRIYFEFDAPSTVKGDPVALLITIRRRPKFSYDEPTRGSLYLDDFTLTEEPDRTSAQLSPTRKR